jgi:NAD(P)-dependent dehydrogenase (short-subunit alcohol dehydrogenase family)
MTDAVQGSGDRGNAECGTACVLLTGAGGVLGTATAIRLARRGQQLLLTDVDADALGRCVDAVRGATGVPGERIASMAVDLTGGDSASALVTHAVERFGGVVGCVNGAGVERPVIASEQLSAGAMRSAYDVNVFALVEVCLTVIRRLLADERPGRIVNVASGAALRGAAHLVTYNSSKHAVLGATRSLAREYAARRIAINAVCPGFVASRMVDRIVADLRAVNGEVTDPRAFIPAGRFAEPDEVAAVIEFLILDAPLYMTGSAVVVDGGLYA